MSFPAVTDQAWADIASARRFYEDQEVGVGDWFVESILTDIESLARFRGIHRQQWGFHKMHASKFQCAIYYRDVSGRAEVVAVLDLRRNPSWLRQQLRKR